jgi:hypothetical protein
MPPLFMYLRVRCLVLCTVTYPERVRNAQTYDHVQHVQIVIQ